MFLLDTILQGTESGVHESLQGDDSQIVDGKNEKSGKISQVPLKSLFMVKN